MKVHGDCLFLLSQSIGLQELANPEHPDFEEDDHDHQSIQRRFRAAVSGIRKQVMVRSKPQAATERLHPHRTGRCSRRYRSAHRAFAAGSAESSGNANEGKAIRNLRDFVEPETNQNRGAGVSLFSVAARSRR